MTGKRAKKYKKHTRHHFEVGDIIAYENEYYGLIISAHYVLDAIRLMVLNKSSHIRQLNLMYSPENNYSYKVINV